MGQVYRAKDTRLNRVVAVKALHESFAGHPERVARFEPRWSPDGRELYFQNGARLMSVAVTPGGTLAASAPHVVHEGRFLRTINSNTSWDLTPDGKRFLRIQQVETERPTTRIDLVLNWFVELE